MEINVLKDFIIYSDADLYPDQKKYNDLILKHHIKREQDEDIDTDDEVL